MRRSAGLSVLLTLYIGAGFVPAAIAAEDDHKHELAEIAPPEAEAADRAAQAERAKAQAAEQAADDPARHDAPSQEKLGGAKEAAEADPHGVKAEHDTTDKAAEAEPVKAQAAEKSEHEPAKDDASSQDEYHAADKTAQDEKEHHSEPAPKAESESAKDAHDDDHKADAHADGHGKEHADGHAEDHGEEHGDAAHADDAHAEEEKKAEPTALEKCYRAAKADDESLAETPSQESTDAAPSETPGDEEAQVKEPYELIRTLEIVQDRIATGHRDAHLYLRELLTEISKKLFLVPDDAWKKPKNSRAAILYALSGGDSRILQKLLDLGPLPCIEENLLKGLLAYSKGDSEIAKSRLMEIAPRTLDSRTSAHFALAQAMLIAAESPKKAMSYLDLARILAPGTLVEEAALRRETVIAALTEDFDTFEMLTSQYFRRFGKSVYAPEFMSRFAVAVSTSKYAEDDGQFASLSQMLDHLSAEEKRSAYVAIIEAAIVRGRVKLTRTVAEKLTNMVNADPALFLQAKLYDAAAMVATRDYDKAVAQLNTIDRNRLAPRDQALFDAALDLSKRIRLPPQVEGPITEPPAVSAEQGKQVEFQQTPQLIDNAKKTIGQADDLLNGDL